jgi:hypothetical protein
MSLTLYIEDMQTECFLQSKPIIPIKAIKVDGEGVTSLKFVLCENALKSCDYIKFTDHEICFIEFSDFYEQLSYLNNINTPLLSSSMTPNELKALQKNKIVIKPGAAIKAEIQTKIAETLLVFDLVCKQYPIPEHLSKSKIFIISLCNIIISDSIIFDTILREIQKKFKAILLVEMFLYSELEKYITDRIAKI